MDKEELENYINKLKKLEQDISSDDESFDDSSFVNDLNSLLGKLQSDIEFAQFDDISSYALKVKVKKLHPNAVIPSYSKTGDAGLDLTATEILNETSKSITYGTGLAFEIPKGYVGLVFPRSSIRKYDLQLSNSVGVIDSGYRGEVQATFNKIYSPNHIKVEDYKIGDRIAQIMIIPYPTIQLEESNSLSDTERGEGGYGSTGT